MARSRVKSDRLTDGALASTPVGVAGFLAVMVTRFGLDYVLSSIGTMHIALLGLVLSVCLPSAAMFAFRNSARRRVLIIAAAMASLVIAGASCLFIYVSLIGCC